MSFVRTVLGDIAAADLGVTYAHEHLVIDGGRPVQLFPDFRLDSVEEAVAELAPARALGLRAVVDAMPADCGRNAAKLAEISRRERRPRRGPDRAPPRALLPRPPLERGPRRRRDRRALRRRRRRTGIDAQRLRGPDGPPDAAPRRRHQDRRRRGPPDARSRRRSSRPPRRPTSRTGVPILTHCEDGHARARSRRASWSTGACARPTSSCRTPTRSSTAATSARSSRPARWSSTTRASAGSRARRTGR